MTEGSLVIDFTLCRFLDHGCSADGLGGVTGVGTAGGGSPHTDAAVPLWNDDVSVAVRAYLLECWLREDGTRDRAAAAIRVGHGKLPRGGELNLATIVEAGLYPNYDGGMGKARLPMRCTPTGAEEAGELVLRALLPEGTVASRRTALLAQDLGEKFAEFEDAVVAETVDIADGEFITDEVHVVFRDTSRDALLLRVTVLPGGPEPAHPGAGLTDPACGFAGHDCRCGRRLTPEQHRLAELRLRAICAGAVLQEFLDLLDPGAFRVGWTRHDLPLTTGPEGGIADGPVAEANTAHVRDWWEKTAWAQQYLDEALDGGYDYGSGEWYGSAAHLNDVPAHELESAAENGDDALREHIDLSDPSDSPHPHYDGMVWVTVPGLREKLGEFAEGCRGLAHDAARDLVDPLLGELLWRPLARVAGPARSALAWADRYDDEGRIWCYEDTGETVLAGEAERILVVGPDEALYIQAHFE
ncbi:hypothetical protein AB0C96_06100 [Streptomyces sp. NPDC048506]|uniref:hypothetical protein n=1 Tax=Streptomyces sp. NPDC048506 TaxID=3155028 RepID=UPI003435C0FB